MIHVKTLISSTVVKFLKRWWVIPLLLSCGFSAQAKTTLHVGGSGVDLATIKIIAQAFSQSNSDIKILVLPSVGSGGAVRGVVRGKLNVGLTSRSLKDKEISPDVRAYMYAKTPLVFVVADSTNVSAVSHKQLGHMYSGKQLQWSNGSNARPILRPVSDSDVLLIKKVIPSLTADIEFAYKRRGIAVAATDQESADLISAVPGAFGTSTMALILSEQRPLKALTLDGVEPSNENMMNGSYPLVKSLYFVVNEPASSAVKQFLEFILAPEAQAILKRTGHMPIEYVLE